MSDQHITILFLCTGNSCRSQMAEGWARHLMGDAVDAYSAGIEAHGLNPLAVKVMTEAGVDISGQRSKTIDELDGIEFEHVITVCDNAKESCPMFPGKTRQTHKSFTDPAQAQGTDEERIEVFRRVRDEIRSFVETLPTALALPCISRKKV